MEYNWRFPLQYLALSDLANMRKVCRDGNLMATRELNRRVSVNPWVWSMRIVRMVNNQLILAQVAWWGTSAAIDICPICQCCIEVNNWVNMECLRCCKCNYTMDDEGENYCTECIRKGKFRCPSCRTTQLDFLVSDDNAKLLVDGRNCARCDLQTHGYCPDHGFSIY